MERPLEPARAAQRLQGEGRHLAEVRARAAGFRSAHVDPIAADLDRRLLLEPDFHPADVVRRAGEAGLLSLPVPASTGGEGGPSLDAAVTLEELAAGCAGIASIFGAHYLGLNALLLGADAGSIASIPGEIARAERGGEPFLCAAALGEPAGAAAAGADARTAARKAEGGWVLDGREELVGGGSVARWTVVVCALDRSRPRESATAFAVERGAPGFSVGRVERRTGRRACQVAELVFDGCFVPDERRIGAEGAGALLADATLAASRPGAAAVATGIARGAYEIALAFARRCASGAGVLSDRPWVGLALADMRASIELSRRAYVAAAAAFDDLIGGPVLGGARAPGGPARRPALVDLQVAECLATSSLADLSSGELAVKVCMQAAEILGSSGVEERERVEKCLRDAADGRSRGGTDRAAWRAVHDGLVKGNGA